jgi:hypothetical protein
MNPKADIRSKWQQLRQAGLDLGRPSWEGEPKDIGFGGFFQEYQQGQIFWHPQTGTHEVHGAILEKYLWEGGPNEYRPDGPERPARPGVRLYGFPKSDELQTADGSYRVSQFEWGAIYWNSAHSTVSSIHGDLYKWLKQNQRSGLATEPVPLGYPIQDPVEVSGGQSSYFERGCLWQGPDDNGNWAYVAIHLIAPPIGRPGLVNPADQSTPHFPILLVRIQRGQNEWSVAGLDRLQHLLTSVWRDKLYLQAVLVDGQHDEIPLIVGSPKIETGNDINPPFDFTATVGAPARDRTLYSLVFRRSDAVDHLLAPHTIYVKQSWDGFGLMHATDMHVSRRLESFRGLLHQANYPDGVALYNCFNDAFRDIIRYANHLHDIGLLDLILVTGDLVDYIFEADDNQSGPGNFELFRKIVLGSAASSNPEVRSEELQVPIFTIPGNHDYRKYPYLLYFDGHLDWLIAEYFNLTTIRNYPSHSLTGLEALAIQNGGQRTRSRPSLTADKASRMVEVDKRNSAYFKYINDAPNYIIRLGKNRIVMLNTKHDTDVVDTEGEAVNSFFGYGTENEEQSATGSPNSIGLVAEDSLGVVSDPLEILKTALAEAVDTQGSSNSRTARSSFQHQR